MTRYLTIDEQSTRRTGPFGAWWAWLTPADHGDVPAGRARAWNVFAVLVAIGAVYGAAHVGHLALFLAIVAAMVAATAVAIVRIERRIQRQSDERVAAFRAVRRLEPVAGTESESEAAA